MHKQQGNGGEQRTRRRDFSLGSQKLILVSVGFVVYCHAYCKRTTIYFEKRKMTEISASNRNS